MCRHYAKTTALARAAEKASVPQCLLQIPPRSHPHQVKTLSITNWLPSENCLNLHDLTCGIPSHLDSLWAEDFLPRTISEPQQVITAPTAGSFETSVCSFPKSLMCINKKWVSESWICADQGSWIPQDHIGLAGYSKVVNTLHTFPLSKCSLG